MGSEERKLHTRNRGRQPCISRQGLPQFFTNAIMAEGVLTAVENQRPIKIKGLTPYQVCECDYPLVHIFTGCFNEMRKPGKTRLIESCWLW
jgi:hypothetical protein